MRKPVFGVSDQVYEVEGCTIYIVKTKALISCVVIMQLICVFVLEYAKSSFSHEAAHIKRFWSRVVTNMVPMVKVNTK